MKIIINSDILYHSCLIRDNLSERLQKLFLECKNKGHIIVLPLTTLLEFNKKQSEFINKKISELENAYKLLSCFNIPFTRVEPSEIIKEPDLIELIKKCGIEVRVEKPTIDDFVEAHKRSCFRECPHSLNEKSDEMRDLIIWMIALRFARQDRGAILISQDVVHVHARGDDEANSVGLVRFKSVEEVLEYFDIETPAGILIRQLITPVWEDLLESGLPLSKEISLVGAMQPRFIQGTKGISNAYCMIKLRTTDGKTLKANIEMKIDNNVVKELKLSDILIDGKPWEKSYLALMPNKLYSSEQDDYNERIDSLKKLFGG